MYRTLREAAELMNVSIGTIYNLKDRGLIVVSRLGVSKGFRISDEEIARFVAERREHRGKDAPSFSPKCQPVKLRHLR